MLITSHPCRNSAHIGIKLSGRRQNTTVPCLPIVRNPRHELPRGVRNVATSTLGAYESSLRCPSVRLSRLYCSSDIGFSIGCQAFKPKSFRIGKIVSLETTGRPYFFVKIRLLDINLTSNRLEQNYNYVNSLTRY